MKILMNSPKVLTQRFFLSKELNNLSKLGVDNIIFNKIRLNQPVWATWQFFELVFHSTTKLKIASATKKKPKFVSLHTFATT